MTRPSPETVAARAGTPAPAPGGTPLVEAISLAAVDSYPDVADLDGVMSTGRRGYRRFGNPSVDRLQEAMSALEGWALSEPPVCRLTASGQAALLLAVSGMVEAGRRKVALLRPCYGGSESLLAGPLATLGVEPVVIDLPPPGEIAHQLDRLEAMLDGTVACVVAEVIGNPLIGLLDLPRLVDICRDAGVASVIDSTFTTPFLLRPFDLGADAVFHSLSKQLSGHSDVIGGALLVRAGHPAAARLDGLSRDVGAVMSPFDAFLSLRGLRTAGLRVARGSANAAALAEVAGRHPAVAAVHYPGRRGPEDEALATRLLPRGRGSMLSLDLGSREAVDRLLEALPEVRLAPSLGDVATTASHPGVSSHRGLTTEQRRALGIGDGLIRISLGIEATEDLTAELQAALDTVAARAPGGGGRMNREGASGPVI